MKTLLFEIDEGIGDSEVLSVGKRDWKQFFTMLENVYAGLAPLTERYRVAVQIYPNWHYQETGYGKDPDEPLNRVSPQLLEAFRFFEKKGMPVYLEMHSSGIRTCQNGELGALTPAPLHYGEREKRKSLPMDMETVEALAAAFPATFAGVRFHELVGSHEIGLHDREEGREESSHAWVVQDEVIRGIITTLKRANLELVWSDHMFNDAFDRPELFSCFKEWVDYALDTLGPNRVTLNWANNGWPMHKYITDTFRFRNYRGARTGMSVQSWFWQELDASTMVCDRGNGFETKWYSYAEMECPPEVMAIFAKKYLEDGCDMLQFEPPYYFFNSYRPGKSVVPCPALVEEAPDASPRLHAKRFFHYLLHPEKMRHLSTRLTDYFDADPERFVLNTEEDPAKRYVQYTLFAGARGKLAAFDRFNGGDFIRQDAFRLTERVLQGGIRCAARAHMGYSGIDDFLLLKESGMELYNLRNGLVLSGGDCFSGAPVLAVAGINLTSEYVEALDGDADELVAVTDAGGVTKAVCLRAVGLSNSLARRFRLEQIATPDWLEFLNGLPSGRLAAIVAPRARFSVLADSTRPPEAGLLAVTNGEAGIEVVGSLAGVAVRYTVKGRALAAAAVDANGNGREQLCLAQPRGSGAVLRFYDAATGRQTGRELKLEFAPRYLFACRAGFQTKAFYPIFRNLNNALI